MVVWTDTEVRRVMGQETYELAGLCAALDVADELLLLLLELGALPVELALRLCEGALVLPQPLRRGDRAPKQRFLRPHIQQSALPGDAASVGARTIMFMRARREV